PPFLILSFGLSRSGIVLWFRDQRGTGLMNGVRSAMEIDPALRAPVSCCGKGGRIAARWPCLLLGRKLGKMRRCRCEPPKINFPHGCVPDCIQQSDNVADARGEVGWADY